MGIWNLFGDDYRKNCLAWQHSTQNPVIPASGNTWKSCWTANPDILAHCGKTLLYYRGNGVLPGTGDARHDRIGVAEIKSVSSDTIALIELADGKHIVDVGEDGAFDDAHVLDPACIEFNGTVWLYYSAVGNGPDSVGLATSTDGTHFVKHGKIMDGRAPDVVVKDGKIFMLYQKRDSQDRYEFFVAHSSDGIRFDTVSDTAVFAHSEGRAWDSHDVVTPRLLQDGDEYFMIYGGSSYLIDQPDYFGLARSPDLIHWERHPGNPIFGCGPKGSEDGGAIWFPALMETEESFVLLYEGSRGNYGGDISSQICMATLSKTSKL